MHSFIAALFIIAKIWKQSKCLSTEEWIKKMWYIYTMEYSSAIKKNETMSSVATWMDLEIITLNEVSHSKRQTLYDITYMWNQKKKKDTHWSSHCGSRVTNLTSICEDSGSIPGIDQWVKELALPQAVA